MHVSDVDPLFLLLGDLGLTSNVVPCGSKQGRQLVGYCQALFAKDSDAGAHTKLVKDELALAGAQFAASHELFLGHWNQSNESFQDWFNAAAYPLLEATGCVPVLITGLEASYPAAAAIWQVGHKLGEPVLVRTLPQDLSAVGELLFQIISTAKAAGKVDWWPLLQASAATSLEFWQDMAEALGENWKYACVAVDPFVTDDVREFLRWQTVVAQLMIGDLTDIQDEMSLPAGMFAAYPSGGQYDLRRYIESLDNDKKDILIILGPSRPEWSRQHNRTRISAVKSLLNEVDVVV